MMAITHNEIRRHPRWRAELSTPSQSHPVHRSFGLATALIIGVVVVIATLAVLLLAA